MRSGSVFHAAMERALKRVAGAAAELRDESRPIRSSACRSRPTDHGARDLPLGTVGSPAASRRGRPSPVQAMRLISLILRCHAATRQRRQLANEVPPFRPRRAVIWRSGRVICQLVESRIRSYASRIPSTSACRDSISERATASSADTSFARHLCSRMVSRSLSRWRDRTASCCRSRNTAVVHGDSASGGGEARGRWGPSREPRCSTNRPCSPRRIFDSSEPC